MSLITISSFSLELSLITIKNHIHDKEYKLKREKNLILALIIGYLKKERKTNFIFFLINTIITNYKLIN